LCLYKEEVISVTPKNASWCAHSLSLSTCTTLRSSLKGGQGGLLDVLPQPRAALPLRLQLTTTIWFRVTNAFHSDHQKMHVTCMPVVGDDGNLTPDCCFLFKI
jgi:hypothetical protein